MGYLNQPEPTKALFDEEGWLHTGDTGEIDKDGFLFVTGRLKELIITEGGENVPPLYIENCLRNKLPYCSNIMVVGDKKKYLCVLLTLKEDNIDVVYGITTGKIDKEAQKELEKFGCNCKTIEEAKSCKQLDENIKKAISEYNSKEAISKAQQYIFIYFIVFKNIIYYHMIL